MSDCGGRGRCREAAPYYYDLGRHDEAAVPEEVRRHVTGCAFCQDRMRRLGESLAGSEDGPGCPAGPEDRQTIETLVRHLDLMDQPVTCAQVKPLLPHLLMASPELRVPTPVTVHVDRCPACAEDLAALRALALPAGQLERLSRLYGAPAGRGDKACRQARSGLATLAALAVADVPTETLDHISTCASCRAEVYQRREQLGTTGRQNAAVGEAVTCPGLAPADLFDLVAPYGLAAHDGVEATATHVRTCPGCREQVQALHRILYGIAEQPDSGVATVYRTADDERAGVEETATRCPVQVQIEYHEPAPTADAGDSVGTPEETARRARVRPGTKSLLKIACAVAVIALVATHFTHGPTATGLNADDILNTLEKAPNVHIASFMGGHAEPYQEMWIARHLRKFAKKSSQERVLYDLRASQRRIIASDGEEETIPLTREERHFVERSMAESVGGLVATISRGMQRKEMTAVGDAGRGAVDGCSIYEVIDDRPAPNDAPILHRWEVTVDSATGLPRRLEWFDKRPGEDEWQPGGCKVFEYLTEREIADAIAALFPPR